MNKIPKRRTKQCPRDYASITVQPFDSGGYFVGGIDGEHFFQSEEDAKMVADALQLLQQHRNIKRRAARVHAELREFLGLA